ncbi:MAG: trehalose-6-phosphate synthase [Nannocystaceae bacterium]|nr:trehalose-6-phosphate synthase [Nannocystaceae bacterium]
MRRVVRLVIVWLCGLALLAWLGTMLVERTTHAWFEKDLRLRAELALRGSGHSLVEPWRRGDRETVREVLEAITRDERVLGAAACGRDGATFVQTSGYPAELDCGAAATLAGTTSSGLANRVEAWHGQVQLANTVVYLAAVPLAAADASIGAVVLVHDLGFVMRREQQGRRFTMAAFVLFAIVTSGATLLTARLSWRDWSDALHAQLRGEPRARRRFLPLSHDVRALIERIVAERDAEHDATAWTPQRLRQTLQHHLRGERVVAVANREPYMHRRDASTGAIEVIHPASGLVTALEPVMRACSGTWVAHGSGDADRATVDTRDRVRVPPGEEAYTLRRVWLSREQEAGYYYGLANEGLWPLCHVAHTRPTFRSEDWRHYREVNQRFADAVLEEVESDDPIVLVQDYHFALVPRIIRARLPRATVIMFWHIPWPNSQRLGICPWRDHLLDGMLGASILGFHTRFDCNNFLDGVDTFLEARIDRERDGVVQQGHTTLVRPYPISIEWPVRWLDAAAPVATVRAEVFASLGLRSDALLGVGVDRLDYTKGVEERLLAVERLLERCPKYRGRFTFVQLAAPSRTEIERYRALNDSVEAVTARVNRRFGSADYRPIVLLRAHHEPPAVFRFYRAADVCYVSSLHDGMNLVAKEFIAARDDERGVLVLSRFTGAARELTEALIVNPYDLDEASAALAAALEMAPTEQRERMRSLRGLVAEFNVYRWAGHMLIDAARVRRTHRVNGRIGDSGLVRLPLDRG